MQIARRLRAVRESLGLEPAEVCRALGFSASLYSNWESGRARPNIDDMTRFCDFYNVPLDWIYRGRIDDVRHSLAQRVLERMADDEQP